MLVVLQKCFQDNWGYDDHMIDNKLTFYIPQGFVLLGETIVTVSPPPRRSATSNQFRAHDMGELTFLPRCILRAYMQGNISHEISVRLSVCLSST